MPAAIPLAEQPCSGHSVAVGGKDTTPPINRLRGSGAPASVAVQGGPSQRRRLEDQHGHRGVDGNAVKFPLTLQLDSTFNPRK